MRTALWISPLLLILTSCSSPPTPPTVNDSHKRPANVAAAVDLQACRGHLQDMQISLDAATRQAQSAHDTVFALVSQQFALATASARLEARHNTVYPVLFGFAGSQVMLSMSESEHLIHEAKGAALVVLSGRTDGTTETPAESRIARQRAVAVRDLLVQGGVDPARIRTTWQPVGDSVAENTSEGGRRRNRRVDVELYDIAPHRTSLD